VRSLENALRTSGVSRTTSATRESVPGRMWRPATFAPRWTLLTGRDAGRERDEGPGGRSAGESDRLGCAWAFRKTSGSRPTVLPTPAFCRVWLRLRSSLPRSGGVTRASFLRAFGRLRSARRPAWWLQLAFLTVGATAVTVEVPLHAAGRVCPCLQSAPLPDCTGRGRRDRRRCTVSSRPTTRR